MEHKKNARAGTNGTGVNHILKMNKVKEFPQKFPENLSLNDLGPQSESEKPNGQTAKKAKPKGNSVALIKRIEDFLRPRYRFRYNEVKNAVEASDDKGATWHDLDERRANHIEAELLRAGFSGVSRTLNVLLQSAPDFDPIAEYLATLPKWDGQTDHIGYLASFVKVTPDRRAWFDLMFKKHLVRLLACATGKIPFNKHCLVLVGGQDAGKSSFVRFLCPPAWKEYYTEEIDFENKDGLIALARNVFVNLDELRNLSRQDINKVKSFISKDHIKARLPFDRRETKLRRKSTFFGSTNNAEFLTDETGNVRWLVLEILDILHDHGGPNGYEQNVDINQVYTQAFTLLQNGFAFQLTAEEKRQSEAYNAAHTKRPIEYELILKFYQPSDDKADFITASDIKRHIDNTTSHKCSPENIGRALRMMGLERAAKKVNGNAVYGYYLKETLEKDWAELADDLDPDPGQTGPPF